MGKRVIISFGFTFNSESERLWRLYGQETPYDQDETRGTTFTLSIDFIFKTRNLSSNTKFWLVTGFYFPCSRSSIERKKWRFCHGAVAHEQSKHLIYGLTYNSYLLPKFIGFSMLYYIGNNLESKNFQI